MSEPESSKLALHWRILIALVAGSLAGVAINPGPTLLPNEKLDCSVKVTPMDTGEFSVALSESTGLETLNRRFKSRDDMLSTFPELADSVVPANQAAAAVSIPVAVSERAIQIVETRGNITIDYTRRHNGRPVSTTIKAGSESKLPAHWQAIHAEFGGGIRRKLTAAAKFGGDLFLRLLKMITVPLIVTSLITGIAGLGSAGRFGAMFGRTLTYYFATSVLAITTGLLVVNLVRPGIGADLPGGTEAVLAGGDDSLSGILLGLVDNMIPTNPLASLVDSSFLSIITFSIIFGVFMIRTGGESAETLRRFFQSSFDVMMRLTMAIISLAPIGVFCFMVFATSSQGLGIFLTLSWYMLAVALGLAIHAGITLPLLLKLVARRSPLEFFRAMSPALMTAFSTASSNGTLPLTMTSVEERAGVSNRTSSFVLPLGATINMDGTALYEAVAVLFIAQAYIGDITLADQIVVAVTALLASVGAAGIPHAGLVMMAIVLQAVHLPIEAQGIIIAVDRVLDMCRTTVNVWSDACGCAVIDKLSNSTES
jgi:proton glutamate symport protein